MIPRRIHLPSFTPVERAIWDAAQAVEALPPDPRLTEAVNLLTAAREKVADYVDASHAQGSAPKLDRPPNPPKSRIREIA